MGMEVGFSLGSGSEGGGIQEEGYGVFCWGGRLGGCGAYLFVLFDFVGMRVYRGIWGSLPLLGEIWGIPGVWGWRLSFPRDVGVRGVGFKCKDLGFLLGWGIGARVLF